MTYVLPGLVVNCVAGRLQSEAYHLVVDEEIKEEKPKAVKPKPETPNQIGIIPVSLQDSKYRQVEIIDI